VELDQYHDELSIEDVKKASKIARIHDFIINELENVRFLMKHSGLKIILQ